MTINIENPIEKEQTIFSHKDNKIITNDKEINVLIKNEEPLVLVLENVLTDKECEQLIQLSKDRLDRSKIGTTHEVNEIRTSSGMFFENAENELITKIEKRISEIMCIPVEHAEGIQVLNYKPGQEYKPHFDYFSEASKAANNNRINTLVMYLNDVEKGGETLFPNLEISVEPKKGTAVYFEYFYTNEELNKLTLHSGNPVEKGEKWVATQWMRRKKIR